MTDNIIELPDTGGRTPDQPAREQQYGNFEAVKSLFGQHNEETLWAHLMHDVSLVYIEEGCIWLKLGPDAPPYLADQVATKLTAWTGIDWEIRVSGEYAHIDG